MFVVNGLSHLLSILIKDWNVPYTIVSRLIWYVTRKRDPGLYEILDYETTLELNRRGTITHFFKRQKVRFLQDNILSFQDYAWGDGDIFADYQCSPGIVADRYRVGDRWNILISLRESKSRGDVEEFLIQSTFKNTYERREEWQQVEIRHRTKHLRANILFPKNRHCKKAVVQLRRQHRSIELGRSNFGLLPDGREILQWEVSNIRPLEVITIRWTW